MFHRRLLILKHICRLPPLRTNTNVAQDTVSKWDLFCGVCLERKPLISRELREIEIKFTQMLREIEDENSMKSDHELQQEAEDRRAAEFKKGNISRENLDKIVGQTAFEFEYASQKELSKFQLAPRKTEADEKYDTKSTDRKLDEHLLFVTKERLGKTEGWLLPQGPLQSEESLREAAERIIREKFGRKVKVKFYGNAPCGFYKYKYSPTIKEGVEGAKVFFMKAQYLGGEVENDQSEFDYSWNTLSELEGKMYESYRRAVRSFVLDDEK